MCASRSAVACHFAFTNSKLVLWKLIKFNGGKIFQKHNFMNLESNQIAAVTQWYSQGASLSDIQKRLKSEFGLSLTYLDIRLLADELKLTREEPEPDITSSTDTILPPPLSPMAGNGHVSVTISSLQKPGALLNGDVTFSDGQRAEWYVDQTGRLGLNPRQAGYRPSKDDVLAFQMELEKIARKQSF
ncbi:MAG: hypothetical protein C5B47_08665 [Verrucomicrobia bacterium]|nr:MAG: hypothetical protein C5B47_08665 [Verrucomicrobiota bacterium]